jgi:CrcB protein
MDVLLVGLGGVVGAVSRYLVGRRLPGRRATATVNVVGSALLGLLVTLPVGDGVALAAGTGFCGAFTTFSSFAVAVAEDATDGRRGDALRYAALMLVGGFLGVVVGALLGEQFFGETTTIFFMFSR